jgi:hypothetical protein
MQYQSRLTEAEPKLTTGQLVTFAQLEDRIHSNIEAAGNIAQELSKAHDVAARERNEINVRVQRICDLLDYVDSATKEDMANIIGKCKAFLSEIPFNRQTGIKSIWISLQKQFPLDAIMSLSDNISPEDDKQMDEIIHEFVEIMNNPKIANTPFSALIKIYRRDLEVIADANEDFKLSIFPALDAQWRAYVALCGYIQSLKMEITYKEIDTGGCAGVSSAPYLSPDTLSPSSVDTTNVSLQVASSGVAGSALQPGVLTEAAPVSAESRSSNPTGGNLATGIKTDVISGVDPRGNDLSTGTATGILNSSAFSGSGRERIVDLVNSYVFYRGLALGYLESILVSPSEFFVTIIGWR